MHIDALIIPHTAYRIQQHHQEPRTMVNGQEKNIFLKRGNNLQMLRVMFAHVPLKHRMHRPG